MADSISRGTGSQTKLADCPGCGKHLTEDGLLCYECEAADVVLVDVSDEPGEFPTEVFPPPWENYVRTLADAQASPLGLCATATLPVVAVGLGSRRSILVDEDANWTEPPILFVALAVPSGGYKSPIMDEVIRPLEELDDDAFASYDVALGAWESLTESERRQLRMERPVLMPWIRSDVTFEQLTNDLKANRSILAHYDELTQWVRRLSGQRYGKDGATERAQWLQMWRGNRIDRARVGNNGVPINIRVKNPRGSVLGGIQNKLLHELCRLEDGMEFRFLFGRGVVDLRKKRKGRIEDADWFSAFVKNSSRLHGCEAVPLRSEGRASLDDFKMSLVDRDINPDLIPKLVANCARLVNIVGSGWMFFQGQKREFNKADVDRVRLAMEWFLSNHTALQYDMSNTEGERQRLTRLQLDGLEEYLRKKCLGVGFIDRRKILQAKVPGIVRSQDLSEAMVTLEARGSFKETVMGTRRVIRCMTT